MSGGALDGIRVIDLSRVLAGPYATMLLADYGAEVIKIEQPGRGDPTREWGPPWFGGDEVDLTGFPQPVRSGRDESIGHEQDLSGDGTPDRSGRDESVGPRCDLTGFPQPVRSGRDESVGPQQDLSGDGTPDRSGRDESVGHEQDLSGDGTPDRSGRGESAYYLTANRNKRSLTLDLKSAEGQAIARRLIATADIVVENFMPGAPAAFGLDYATLSAEQPGLIYCSITGYGQDGPNRDRPGYDFMVQAEGGVMSITGPAEGEPHKVGVAIVDISAGLYAVTAILAALHHRAQTGRGQWIDVALFDAQLGWLANVASNYLISGRPPARHGNAHPNIVPYEAFPTADGFIAVGIGSDAQWRRFVELAGRPDLGDEPRYAANAGRVAAREELIGRLQEVFRGRTTAEWLAALREGRIPAAPINDIPTALSDPQAQARRMVQTVAHPAGPLLLVGPVAKLSETPATVRTAPPLLGQHTEAILREELGYSPGEIDALRRDGVI